jgi:hypothetical protein
VGVVGSRPFVVKGSLNNGQTSYVQNNCVGGLITIATSLPPGTILTAFRLSLRALYSTSNAGVLLITMLDGNPTASTISDNVAQSLNSADLAKVQFIVINGNSWSQNGSGGYAFMSGTGTRIQVDANGNLYFWISAGAGVTFASANNVLWEFDGTF